MDEMRQKIIEHFAALTDEQLEAEMKAANYDFYKTVTTNVLDPCADLRAKLKQVEEERDELRTKGAYWETLVRSWPESLEARLAAKEAELVLAAKVMDTCEETLRYVLNYVEGQGLSAEQDVKESIELIHMFRDAEVVRRLEGERTMNCLGGAVMIKAICVGGCILFVISMILLLIVTIRRIWRG
jgi:hypothetical protein